MEIIDPDEFMNYVSYSNDTPLNNDVFMDIFPKYFFKFLELSAVPKDYDDLIKSVFTDIWEIREKNKKKLFNQYGIK